MDQMAENYQRPETSLAQLQRFQQKPFYTYVFMCKVHQSWCCEEHTDILPEEAALQTALPSWRLENNTEREANPPQQQGKEKQTGNKKTRQKKLVIVCLDHSSLFRMANFSFLIPLHVAPAA